MSTEESTTSNSNLVQAGFTTATLSDNPLYMIREDNKLAINAQLNMQLLRLSSMLTMISGEGYESFSTYSEEIQQHYLWACSGLARECEQLAGLL